MRNKGIIAYGTQEDRDKLAVLAKLQNQSGSEVIIRMIREKFEEIVPGADPKALLAMAM